MLCAQHNIDIIIRKFPKGYCGKHFYRNRKTRSIIRIGPVSGPISYFKAMYHIAHCVTAKCHRGTLLHKKAEAWKWVMDNSIIGVNEDLRKIINKNLTKSLDWVLSTNERKEKVISESIYELEPPQIRRFKLPPENSIFWKMIRYGDGKKDE